MFHNNHNSYSFDDYSNLDYDEVDSDYWAEMLRTQDTEAPYEILISLGIDDFQRRFKSVSALYRILSKSNQGIGITNPTLNHTNRKWWRYHFNGGEYRTHYCENMIHIHFILDMNEDTAIPSEVQMKMRILKSFKGYKPFILVGVNNTTLQQTAREFLNCYSRTQIIGDRYTDSDDLPF